ncbi:hypothetical protein AVEN_268428-1 [Araneus ventricosus]|uniref:Uncharacterized protein n=1 Tax=Araneus ventricosus TaxID=182803 RepID=A0A4Y2DTD1_ARAVE|nr:hypothetical protein AVEN_268428-1 [Araneus ventricosus]
MTKMTPALASLFQISASSHREDAWLLCMIYHATGPIHGGSSVKSGFEPGTLQHRDLATRPKRPMLHYERRRYKGHFGMHLFMTPETTPKLPFFSGGRAFDSRRISGRSPMQLGLEPATLRSRSRDCFYATATLVLEDADHKMH